MIRDRNDFVNITPRTDFLGRKKFKSEHKNQISVTFGVQSPLQKIAVVQTPYMINTRFAELNYDHDLSDVKRDDVQFYVGSQIKKCFDTTISNMEKINQDLMATNQESVKNCAVILNVKKNDFTIMGFLEIALDSLNNSHILLATNPKYYTPQLQEDTQLTMQPSYH